MHYIYINIICDTKYFNLNIRLEISYCYTSNLKNILRYSYAPLNNTSNN